MNTVRTPLATVRRFCLYQRFLERLASAGSEQTSSTEIGEHTGIPAYQVRKDINHLGEVGVIGRGYGVSKLLGRISTHMGFVRVRRCVVVGMGALGTALARYLASDHAKFDIVAGFDNDKRKAGRKVGGVPVHLMAELPAIVREHEVEIGVLTVPAPVAQETTEQMVESGITGVLNFTSSILSVPDRVAARSIDLGVEIEMLSYLLGGFMAAAGRKRAT